MREFEKLAYSPNEEIIKFDTVQYIYHTDSGQKPSVDHNQLFQLAIKNYLVIHIRNISYNKNPPINILAQHSCRSAKSTKKRNRSQSNSESRQGCIDHNMSDCHLDSKCAFVPWNMKATKKNFGGIEKAHHKYYKALESMSDEEFRMNLNRLLCSSFLLILKRLNSCHH